MSLRQLKQKDFCDQITFQKTTSKSTSFKVQNDTIQETANALLWHMTVHIIQLHILKILKSFNLLVSTQWT